MRGVTLLESSLEDLEGHPVALPNAVFATGEEVPEA